MLIFNDGKPRSGKSYDTMLEHVLPALKKGRHVWARIDGLGDDDKRQRIADYLKVPRSHVEKFLHHLDADAVVPKFQCVRDGNKYSIPDEFRDSLAIIDECHEFYPASTKPLQKQQEQFFARHGQFGMDIVLASQDFGALHDDVRCRVERKVLFRKLSHFAGLKLIGIGGKDKYSKRYYVAAGSGKFKELGTEQHKYKPEIFPLYQGFQPGVENTEVYEGGKKEAAGWGLKFYVPLALVAGVVGVWYAYRFFNPDTSPLAHHPGSSFSANQGEAMPGSVAGKAQTTPKLPQVVKPPEKVYKAPGVRYVMELIKAGNRVRMAGKYAGRRGSGGWVEFRSTQDHVADRLSFDDLRDLGFSVIDRSYGVDLLAEGETVIATSWPLDDFGRVSERDNSLASGSGAGTRASVGTPASGPVMAMPANDSGAGFNSADVSVQPAGGMRGYVGTAPSYTGGTGGQ